MATVFNRSFDYARLPQPTYDSRGNAVVNGGQVIHSVRGTVQPLNGKETVPAVAASRNTGTVKVYSTERLDFRAEDGTGLGFVRLGGYLYELVDEMPYQNLGPIKHWKYIGCLVPPAQVNEILNIRFVVDDQNRHIVDEFRRKLIVG